MSKTKYQFSLTSENQEKYNRLYKLRLHAHAVKMASIDPETATESDYNVPTRGELQNEIAEAGILALLERYANNGKGKKTKK